MKISYHWLVEMLDSRGVPSPEKVEELLTFGAFEVEGMEKQKDDTILDVKVLANRASDCLSHRGIAREVGALLHVPLVKDPFAVKNLFEGVGGGGMSIHVEDASLCDRYIGVLIEGVTVGPSPSWLKNLLEALGHRSINNIVDITNYVMLETGQPLHAFDAGRLQKKNDSYVISVRRARQGEEITSLTGELYPLGEDDLLIVDGNANTPIGIAGVKGGKHAEITPDTTSIILEAAHFSWVSVRKTARRHVLATDASKRFEHNPSPHLARIGALRALELVLDVAGGTVVSVHDAFPHPPAPRSISITQKNIESILGFSFSSDEIITLLESVGCTVSVNSAAYAVVPPFERTDLLIIEDFVEEIGRLAGLSRVQNKPLSDPYRPPAVNDFYAKETRVRQALVDAGFSEVITTVFVPKGQGEILLENPIASDRPALRNRILPYGFSSALSLNTKNMPLWGAESVRLFEIGTVFTKEGERLHLAIGVHMQKDAESRKALDEIEQSLSAALSVDFNALPSKDTTKREYNLSHLFASMPNEAGYARVQHGEERKRFTPISPYPFVMRDIAVWAPLGVESRMIASRIDSSAGPLMVHRSLFDEFKRGNETSFAFHIVFQSGERTLTAAEVNERMLEVEDAMKKSGWTVR